MHGGARDCRLRLLLLFKEKSEWHQSHRTRASVRSVNSVIQAFLLHTGTLNRLNHGAHRVHRGARPTHPRCVSSLMEWPLATTLARSTWRHDGPNWFDRLHGTLRRRSMPLHGWFGGRRPTAGPSGADSGSLIVVSYQGCAHQLNAPLSTDHYPLRPIRPRRTGSSPLTSTPVTAATRSEPPPMKPIDCARNRRRIESHGIRCRKPRRAAYAHNRFARCIVRRRGNGCSSPVSHPHDWVNERRRTTIHGNARKQGKPQETPPQ